MPERRHSDTKMLLELVGEAYAFRNLSEFRSGVLELLGRVCRERNDFSDQEVQLLALARPHLMHAYRNAELWGEREAMLIALQQGLDTVGRHVVVLDPHGRVEFASDGARHLLGPQLTTALPGEVNRWLASQHTPRAAAAPLRIPGPDGSVLVRVLPTSRGDRRQVLLLETGTGELTVTALRALGLTDRQAQALHTIALGHTPTETAARMGIAIRPLLIVGIAVANYLRGVPTAGNDLVLSRSWRSSAARSASRFAFIFWITHSGAASIADFSAQHAITGSAWTVALLAMAVCEVVARSALMAARRQRLDGRRAFEFA